MISEFGAFSAGFDLNCSASALKPATAEKHVRRVVVSTFRELSIERSNNSMILKVLLFTSLLVHSTNLVFAQNLKSEIYTKYINCNLNYFLDNESEDALFNGLKAIIYGKYDKAEELLLSVIPQVSDSLKAAIYNDLVYINYAKKNWTKGNEYVLKGDPNFDPETNPYSYFDKYPDEHLELRGKSVSVDFIDNFYVHGTINDNDTLENIVVDTGAPQTIISISLALKYDFEIDSTKAKGTASGLAIQTSAHSALMKKLKIGEVTFFNVPVIVIGNEMFRTLGLKGELILGIPEMMMFDIVKFDYPNKKFTMIKKGEKEDSKPNFAILDLKPIISYHIRNETTSGLLDTGSPYSYLYSERWDANKEKKIRTVNKSVGGYKFKVNYYKIPISFSGGLKGDFEIAIHPNRLKGRHKTESLLGIDIWENKILTIDFKNRIISFKEN